MSVSQRHMYIIILIMTAIAERTICDEEAEDIFAVKNVSEPNTCINFYYLYVHSLDLPIIALSFTWFNL